MKAIDCLVPQKVRLITFGVDSQIDRCELEFVGWAEGEESFGLGYFKIPGDFSKLKRRDEPNAYDQLEATLTRVFIREDGARLTPVCGCFDTGYAKNQRALYQYLRPRFGRLYFATKGSSNKWDQIWRQGRRDDRIRLYLIGTNRAKALIYDRASISVEGPGYCHFPNTDDYDDEYFKQLLAEDSHTERANGVEMRIFEMPATPRENETDRNEALDIRVLALAALYIRGPVNWEAEEKKNLLTIPPKNAPARSKQMGGFDSPAARRQRRPSNWLNMG